MNREAVLLPGTYAAIPKALLAVPSAKLSPAAKLVWMVVVEHFGDKDHSWPGAGTIAKMTGLTRRGVQKAIEQLVELKLLTVLPPEPGRASNTYRLTEFASALSSLAHGVRTPSAQSSLGRRTECARGSEQSAPELPNTTTEATTERTTEVDAAPPLGACGPGRPAGGSPPSNAVKRKRKSPSAREGIDVAAVCADLGSMKTHLTSGQLNWERHRKSENDLGVENWNAQEFAGYWWFQVSSFRTHKNIPLNLPAFGKLIGIMSNLRKQMPAQQLVGVIDFVVHYFDVIRFMLRSAGNTVALDETSLVNPLVKGAANNLMRASDEERERIVADYRAATSAAAA